MLFPLDRLQQGGIYLEIASVSLVHVLPGNQDELSIADLMRGFGSANNTMGPARLPLRNMAR